MKKIILLLILMFVSMPSYSFCEGPIEISTETSGGDTLITVKILPSNPGTPPSDDTLE